MSVVSQEVLKNGKGGKPVSGVVLIKSYSIQLTRNGKEYISGTLQSGVEIPFKIWSDSSAFTKLKNENYTNVPTMIGGTFDEYGGSLSIVLTTADAVEGFTIDQFLPVKYNADAYFTTLVNTVRSSVSEKAFDLASKILFDNAELCERFKIEFAAKSHHDNCKSGLLAHTYKVVTLVNNFINLYPSIITTTGSTKNQDLKDLLILGALLHDIGKTKEMELGIYQPCSSVTHRYLGVEFVTPYKDEIVSAYNEDWYYQLISVFLQHHDTFDDKARTLVAMIVFYADWLDSRITLIQQQLEMPITRDGFSSIKYEDRFLQLLQGVSE